MASNESEMDLNPLTNPFKPRSSLGRSPPGGLAPPPILIESKAKHPLTKERNLTNPGGSSTSKESLKENKRKERSPEELKAPKKKSKDTDKRLKIARVITSSDEDSNDEPSSSEEDAEKSSENTEITATQQVMLSDAIHNLTALLTDLMAKKKTLTASVSQTAKAYLKQIGEGVDGMKVAYATLKGKYKEAGKINYQLMEFRNGHEKFIKECKMERKELKDLVTKTMKDIEDKSIEQNTMTQPSYANMVKSMADPGVQNKKDTKVVLFYPREENKAQTSEETKDMLQRRIKPVQHGIKINRVAKIRNGGVALEVHRDHAQSVLDKVGNSLSSREPTKRLPKLKIFDVPVHGRDDGAIIEDIRAQNFPEIYKDEFADQVKVVYKVGPKNQPTCHWVIEASPKLRETIVKNGDRIYLGWSSCKIIDHIIITRCFKCQRFGHLAKACTAKTETCGHCAKEGHSFKDCPDSKWEFKCSNCIRAKLKSNHSVNSAECSVYLREKHRITQLTDYGQEQ